MRLLVCLELSCLSCHGELIIERKYSRRVVTRHLAVATVRYGASKYRHRGSQVPRGHRHLLTGRADAVHVPFVCDDRTLTGET